MSLRQRRRRKSEDAFVNAEGVSPRMSLRQRRRRSLIAAHGLLQPWVSSYRKEPQATLVFEF
jgi:hypothetical protein